ncbi:MAG: efflux RND transporter periplasmic adaptor subunit [Candidatus Vogelbacteria bacterium]|nr:efflux RND transporter periplasmic adaptor subunit [Candidatus Vogelbacteria bacterium]
MINIFEKQFKLRKRYWWIGGLSILALALIAFFFLRNTSNAVESYSVSAGPITQTVSVAGETRAESYVDLAFEQTGLVSFVGPRVGGTVGVGQILVSLDKNKAYAELSSTQANLDYQKAKLNDSKISLGDVERNLDDSLRGAYFSADDILKNYVNQFFKNPNSSSPSFEIQFYDNGQSVSLSTNDYVLRSKISTGKRRVDRILEEWKADIYGPDFLKDKEKSINITRNRLEAIQTLLDDISLGVNSFDTGDYSYLSTINNYKSTISSARTSVNEKISNISSFSQDWNSARLSAAELSNGQVSTQSAQIKQAEAQVAEKQALLSKLSLTAPISGVVTKQEAKVGESVSAGEVLVSILNPDSFEVEANIPEINIGKIKVGQKSTITLDAFPGENFSGEVFYIDPAETLIDGVVNYKIKVSFTEKDERLKNGLTANLSITTDSKDQVVVVPVYAITTDKGVSTVKKYINGQVVATPVKLGIYGDNGLVEVIEGLVAGDKIEVKAQ